MANLRRLVVGTDASLTHAGAGVAAVTADGRYSSAGLPEVSDITDAELHAISLGVRTFRTKHRPRLEVLSDSRAAVSWLYSEAKRPKDRPAFEWLRALILCEDLKVTWVKGHADNLLNQQADSIARCNAPRTKKYSRPSLKVRRKLLHAQWAEHGHKIKQVEPRTRAKAARHHAQPLAIARRKARAARA